MPSYAERLNRKLEAAGIKAEAIHVPARDSNVDDELEIRIAGVPASISIQLGRGYYGVNRYFFVNGVLDGAAHLYEGGNFNQAADCLINALQAE